MSTNQHAGTIDLRKREDLPKVVAALVVDGYRVFQFTMTDLGAFGRGDGWEGHLKMEGYNHRDAKAIHFEYERGAGLNQVVLVVGAAPLTTPLG